MLFGNVYLKLLIVQTLVLMITSFSANATDKCIRNRIGCITFSNNRNKISISNKRELDSIVTIVKLHSECAIVVFANGKVNCFGNTRMNQRKWDRIQSIIDYLKRSGIQSSRIVFQFGAVQEDSCELYLDSIDEFHQNLIPPSFLK